MITVVSGLLTKKESGATLLNPKPAQIIIDQPAKLKRRPLHRYPIQTAPKNGHTIVLEDEASGSFEIARWSTETDEWIGEYGETSRMTPSHWHPCYSFLQFQRVKTPLERSATEMTCARAENVRIMPLNKRRGSTSWLIGALAIASLVGGVYLQRAMLDPQAFSATTALERDVAKAQSRTETTGLADGNSGASEVAPQPKQSIESATAELRQSLQQEHDRAEALAAELAQVRQTMEEKKAIAVEDSPAIKPSAGVAVEQSEAENNATEAGPQRRRAVSHNAGAYCQQYRTYNPSSGTYRGYDGQLHSCP